MMVYEGIIAASGLTGMKPEKKPVTDALLLLMGSQGWSNVDCTMLWFCAANSIKLRDLVRWGTSERLPWDRSGIAPYPQQELEDY